MSRVLMLSGAGWVGHNVANKLVGTGCEVTVIHLKMEEKFVPYLNNKVRHILGNVSDEALCRDAVEQANPDVVISLHPSPERVERDYQMLKGRIGHYLHCSSAGVYVPTGKQPVDENAPTYNKEEYGEAFIHKNKVDKLAMSKHDKVEFPVTIVRPGIILGHGFTPLELWGFRNPEFFRKIQQGEQILLSNQMDTMMSIAHVKDVAEVFVKAVVNPQKSKGEIFNAVSLTPFKHADYLAAIGRVLGNDPVVEYADTEDVIRQLTGQQKFSEPDYRFFMADLSASGSKAKDTLGVSCELSLQQILEESLVC